MAREERDEVRFLGLGSLDRRIATEEVAIEHL